MISFFVVLFFIVGGVGYRFTKSIILLKQLMTRAEMGDLTVMAPQGKQDEIGSLYRSFNSMVTEIGRLINVVHSAQLRERNMVIKQKEAVLSALQSQINPHFLNNTLEIINSYAIIDGNFKVSNMIVALGDLFRYSMDSPTSIVSLADEMNHLRSYLQIQQERFEHLQLDIQVAKDDAEGCMGVRLMLQPIVENSFKHGYDKHKLRPGTISIVGKEERDGYALYIQDTGKGMEPSTLERINRILQSGEAGYSKEGDDPQPIGMMNVHFRIRMIFGEPFGLWIVQSNLEGTTIRILLPRHNKGME
jgi:two-component system sensor histidine kinase YesM